MVILMLKRNLCLTPPILLHDKAIYHSIDIASNFLSLCHCLCCTCSHFKIVHSLQGLSHSMLLHEAFSVSCSYKLFSAFCKHFTLTLFIGCSQRLVRNLSSLSYQTMRPLRKESENHIYPYISYNTLPKFLHIQLFNKYLLSEFYLILCMDPFPTQLSCL